MGWFDYYEPVQALSCPVCQSLLQEWQGYGGLCGMLLWRQGFTAPVDQLIDDEVKLFPDDIASKRLPEKFLFFSWDCECPYPVEAEGLAPNGTWIESRVITSETATQRREETRAQ